MFKFRHGIIIFIAVFIRLTRSEYYSSMDGLAKLSKVELDFARILKEYLNVEQTTIANYRKFLAKIKSEHNAIEDTEDFLGNPINAFALIKRMVVDWSNVHNLTKDQSLSQIVKDEWLQVTNSLEMPNGNDIQGAIKGIMRLQHIYKFDTYDLIAGEINGIYYNSTLTLKQCFTIAVGIFNEKEYELAIKWFTAIIDLLKYNIAEYDENLDYFEVETLEYLALSNYELGATEKALLFLDEILLNYPEHNVKEIQVYMSSSTVVKQPYVDSIKYFNWYQNYTRLCQGKQQKERVHHTLCCKVATKSNPNFFLAPLKIEPLSLDPEVTLYHGLLTDNQIDKLLELAASQMVRSTVVNGTGNAVRDIRVSQQAWLDYTTPTMKAIQKLVAQISGLDLINSETMQLANYGIGGQYDPHHDFLGARTSYWIGDRITTHMFYLSDVEQGGYTVFPKLNIFSNPIKGSLLTWFNLHKSVDPDYRTLHAGCPVIKGSKRIGNIWTHSGYQEFTRPCEFESDTHKSTAYID